MRILLIEDDLETQKMLAAGLKSAGFAVDATASGEEGSYLARTNEYDLIILDYILPDKTGLEICKELRSRGKTMPILMLSARSAVADKVELLNHGADDYLGKPFSYEELLARANALLRRPPAIAPAVLVVGEATIDCGRQVVTCGTDEVYLTRKEFSLLEYLARHAGTVVSRGMIMEHVWNMDSDIFSNTIETHILALRKKLHSKMKRKLIHTVPGRGYKLEARSG